MTWKDVFKQKARDDSMADEGRSSKKIKTGLTNSAEMEAPEMEVPEKRTVRPKNPAGSKTGNAGAKKRNRRVKSTALVADKDMADDEPSEETAGLTMLDKGKKKADEGLVSEMEMDGVELLGSPGENATACERCHSTGRECIRTGGRACEYCRKMKSRCSLTQLHKEQKTKGVPRIKPKKTVSAQPTVLGPSSSDTYTILAAMPDTATDTPAEGHKIKPKPKSVKAPARQRISVIAAHPDEPRGKIRNLSACHSFQT
jgi:hypothetical protein